MPTDDLRSALKDVSAALIDLHRELLRSAQREYEVLHGPVGPPQLLQLAAFDPHFAWLRTVSELVVELDERVKEPEPIDPEVAAAFRAIIERRLSSEEAGFLERLRSALQASPEVAMTMGGVRQALRSLPTAAPGAEEQAARP